MGRLIVKSDAILLPSGLFDGYIVSENGGIVGVTKNASGGGEYLDATGYYVSPGFIDIHTHGGGGHDFMDGNAGAVREACLAHMRHGTTTILPSSVACGTDELLKFIDCFNEAKQTLTDGPHLWGAHLEGPYFNPSMAGAQDPAYIKNPDPDEYKAILERADGMVARWSVAPELPGALEMGDFLAGEGVLVSIGHSAAEYDDVRAAADHHYTLFTHLYSGMSTIVRKGGYRKLGVIESAYLMDDMYVEIIADGHHLPAELLKLIVKCIDRWRIILITDSMRAAGTSGGESIIGSLTNGQKVIVEDGVAKLPDRTAFAGSVATADVLIRTMRDKAGLKIEDAVKMMTVNPARAIGAEDKGVIAAHMDCDLVVFDEDIDVKAVVTVGIIRHATDI